METQENIEKLQGDSLLVIGNGFDLACGLKSKYKQFFDYRKKHTNYTNKKNKSKSMDYALNAIDHIMSSDSDDFLRFGYRGSGYYYYHRYYYNGAFSPPIKSRKNSLDVRVTVWDYYFRFLNENLGDPDWYLVEKKIKDALTTDREHTDFFDIFNNHPSSNSELMKFAKKKFEISKKIREKIDDKYAKERRDLEEKIKSLRGENKEDEKNNFNSKKHDIFDCERKILALGKIYYGLINYLIGDVSFGSKSEWSDVNSRVLFLLAELKLFEKSFGDYIIFQTQTKEDEYNRKANKLFFKFMNMSRITMIESFNYSSPELMIGVPTRHINGECESPIFGIDFPHKDNSQSPRNLFPFTKTSRRMELQFVEKHAPNRGDFENLIVYGHSLNEQDYNYFFPIFDYLKISDTAKTSKIVFCYSIYKIGKEKDEESRDRIKKETQEEIRNLIFAYDKYLHSESQHEMRLLDSIIATGRMKIVEIESPQEKTNMDVWWA